MSSMAEGGVVPPPPPKRPSIRPPPPRPSGDGTSGSGPEPASLPKVPARSTPPVPGGKVPPKLPDRPPGSNTSVPLRGNDSRKSESMKLPPRPASTAGDKPLRKRPEITIVSARPMSEVGFRDVSKNTNQSNDNTTSAKNDNQSNPTTEFSTRRLPAVPPRTDKIQSDSVTETKLIRPPSGRPPPIPQQAPSRDPPTTTVLNATPPSPRPRASPRQSVTEKVSPQQGTENESSQVTSRKASDISSQESNESLSNVSTADIPYERPRSSSYDVNVEPPANEGFTNTTTTNIKKTSRPTIIRPQKKGSIKKSQQESSPGTNELGVTSSDHFLKGSNSDVNVGNQENLTPVVMRPKPAARERPKSMSIADSIRKFEIQTNFSSDNLETIDKPPPPIAPKPKPNVLPKPKQNKPVESSSTASLSSSLEKPVMGATSVTPSLSTSTQKIQASSKLQEPSADQKNLPMEEKPVDQPLSETILMKRPTIIRAPPPKPKRSSVSSPSDVEETETLENKERTDPENIPQVKRRVKATVDDSVVNRGNKAPPLPSKRPVSVAGVPQGFSLLAASVDVKSDVDHEVEANKPKPATRSSTYEESGHAGSRKEGPHRPKIIGRPPPPVRQEIQDESSIRSSKPAIMQKTLLTAVLRDKDTETKESDRSSAAEGGRPPPPKRPTSLDPRIAIADKEAEATTKSDKPPVRPMSRPSPVMRQKNPAGHGESSQRQDEEESKEKDEKLRPSRPKSGPVRSPSVTKQDKRKTDKPEKPQPPSSAAVRRASVPQPPPPVTASSPPKLPTRPTPGHPLYHYMTRVPHGIAQHDFDGVHEEDLSFKVNDMVLLLSRLDESWLRGKVNEREGIFPQEFVQIVVPLINEYCGHGWMPTGTVASAGYHGYPTMDYGENKNLFNCKKVKGSHFKFKSPPVYPVSTDPTVVSVPAWDDNEETEDYGMADDQSAKKPDLIGNGPRCCARFDFEGEGESDLQFEEGDYIRLLEKIGDEWAKGEINGQVGMFPLVYVEIIEDLPQEGSTVVEEIQRSKGHRDSESESQGMSSQKSSDIFPSVVAAYDFDESGPGDLPLKVGDHIKVYGFVNDDWLYGECNGREGQFPAQFIDHIPGGLQKYDPTGDVRDSPMERQIESCVYCVALHSFVGESDEELSFVEGDRILILEEVGTDWYRGKLNDRQGIFPANFVEKENKIQGANQGDMTSAKQKEYGIALYDFDAQAANELTFKVGDQILLGDIVGGAPDWRWGQIGDRQGIFPANFVTLAD